jgi:DNA-binding beta-propeller fold protein YncE
LILESRISLPDVSGRIDHLAADIARKRLFVAERGDNALDVIDLSTQKRLRRITGLIEPQGVAYLPQADLVVVANGGDGTVRFFSGADFSPHGVITLGDDADNVRVDPRNGHVLVGFGTEQIAVIDPSKPKWLANIPLPSHPEGFGVSLATGRMFVNAPIAGKLVMVDLATETGASWVPRGLEANFPMALDETGRAVIVVFRQPARLATFNMMTGEMTATAPTCGDSDDVFFDEKRRRIYVSCGAGSIDVIDRSSTKLVRVALIRTSRGARTSLFVPGLDRLYLAAPSNSTSKAAIQIYRPSP